MHENCLNVERIWINRVTSEIVFNLHTLTMVLKLPDERIIAVQEEYDLHLESYQRGVTDGMRISWNFLLKWREGKLAKEIDESTSVEVDYVVVSLTVGAEGTEERILALRTEQQRFNVEKVSDERQVNWKELVLR